MLIRRSLLLLALVLVAGCARKRIAARMQNTEQMRAAVLEIAPVGSSMDSAVGKLEREGISCALLHGSVASRAPGDYLWCDAPSAGSTVTQRWQIAIVGSSGKVSDVKVALGVPSQ